MTLDDIRKLIEAATPGPWTADKARPNGYVAEQDVVRAPKPINLTTDVIAVCNRDARFIAAARTLLPALLTTVEDMADELLAAKDADPYICKAESVDRLLAALEAIKLP